MRTDTNYIRVYGELYTINMIGVLLSIIKCSRERIDANIFKFIRDTIASMGYLSAVIFV